jgi:hypothetical protein
MGAQDRQGARVAPRSMSLAHLASVLDQVHVKRVTLARPHERLQEGLGFFGGGLPIEEPEATTDAKDVCVDRKGGPP